MENPLLDFEMEQSEKLKKAFYQGYEAGKKDAEYYALHCGNTDEPETNVDRIRSMSVDELALFIVGHCFADCPDGYTQIESLCSTSSCVDCWRDWLKQEVSDEK